MFCSVLLGAMDTNKRKTETSLKFTFEVMENVNRRLDARTSKRSATKGLEILELTLIKRLKVGTVTNSQGHFKTAFANKEDKELAERCRY
jgi:hypothetical protein